MGSAPAHDTAHADKTITARGTPRILLHQFLRTKKLAGNGLEPKKNNEIHIFPQDYTAAIWWSRGGGGRREEEHGQPYVNHHGIPRLSRVA